MVQNYTADVGSVVAKTAPTETKTLLRLESIEIETRPRLYFSNKNNKTEKKNDQYLFLHRTTLFSKNMEM